MKLFGFFRSSAAYRVRIALNLKGLTVEHIPVHLRRKEQLADQYVALNPQGLVPTLVTDDGAALGQSLAILEYLEETHPEPALLPAGATDRAHVRAIALAIACDIHPINNLRVLNYLKAELGQTQEVVDRWYAHWIATGLAAVEAKLAADRRTASFCLGDTPGLADICLVPQVANAERMNCPLDAFPTIRRITANARALPAFQAAEPGRQPDAE